MRTIVALLAAALLAVGVGACGSGSGGSSPSAVALVADTFHSHQPIDSGRLQLSLALSAQGSTLLREPVSLRVSGPFQSAGATELPRFALQLGVNAAGHTLNAGATSTGGQFFVALEGASFVAPQSTYRALQEGYAQASRTAGSAKSDSTFASLGIDPGGWLENPVRAGTAQVGGVQTVHVVANLNVGRFLADADRLSGAGGALGVTGGAQGGSSGSGQNGSAGQGIGGLFAPAQVSALAASVRSARVDVYTGAGDHLLRRLTVSAALATTPQQRAALGGLRSATLALQLQFSDLNQPQQITAPSSPKPLSELLSELQQLGLIRNAPSSGQGTGAQLAPGLSQVAPPAYVQCAKQAGSDVQALQRCAALLGAA